MKLSIEFNEILKRGEYMGRRKFVALGRRQSERLARPYAVEDSLQRRPRDALVEEQPHKGLFSKEGRSEATPPPFADTVGHGVASEGLRVSSGWLADSDYPHLTAPYPREG